MPHQGIQQALERHYRLTTPKPLLLGAVSLAAYGTKMCKIQWPAMASSNHLKHSQAIVSYCFHGGLSGEPSSMLIDVEYGLV